MKRLEKGVELSEKYAQTHTHDLLYLQRLGVSSHFTEWEQSDQLHNVLHYYSVRGIEMIKKPLRPTIGLVSEAIVKTAEELTVHTEKKPEGTVALNTGKAFNLPRDVYQSYLFKRPAGHIHQFTHNSCKVTLLSQYTAGLNLYKMLNLTRPSAVLLQVRCDDIFSKGFTLNQTSPEFVSNIKRTGVDLMPSATHYYNTTLVLKRLRIFPANLHPKPDKIRQSPYTLIDRVHDYTVAYACRWGLHRRFDRYYVGDLPREAFTRQVLGTLSLVQLKDIFASTCKMMMENPDIILRHEPRSPLTAAYKLYPDIFLAPSDRFLAWLLTTLTSSHKSLFCVLGNGQSQTLPLFLEKTESGLSYEEMMKPDWRFKGFLSSETMETAIEKRAIVDIMTFGLDLISSISSHKALKRTETFISDIISEANRDLSFTLSFKDRQEKTHMLTLLYLSCLQKYKSQGLEQFSVGRTHLKADFMTSLT